MNDGHLAVFLVAGLSGRLLKDEERCPALADLIRRTRLRYIKPVLPAVTCTAQATYTTGLPPAGHGIIANGNFFADRRAVSLWEHSALMIEQPRIWDALRRVHPSLTTAVLLWWNTQYSTADYYMNVAPKHTAGGETISSCYSKPPGLYGAIEEKLGPFPLHNFWGPMASLPSSEWICKATLHTLETLRPNLLLTYIPELDYSLQKFGPDAPETREDLRALDALLAETFAACRERNAEIVVLSEYGMAPVNGAVTINRALREAGLLSVRVVGGREYLDFIASRAFAMVDHQVAHVYVFDPAARDEVRSLLESLDGVARVLDEHGKREFAIDHAHSGDFVALSERDKWFAYYWWLDEAKAPDFAFTVDIHRKPGFDPLELFFNRQRKRIETDTSLIKGSHGLAPDDERDMAVCIGDLPGGDGTMAATDVMDAIVGWFRR
ncbi:MAG: alkaline phosphatase family protein [Planctomycetota bacterium]|nr:MAG: alkaline phosphatase family protein [Planctomycetota bacterium]